MKNTHPRHRIAMAIAASLLAANAPPAGSAVVVVGPYFGDPGGAVLANGANVFLPGTQIWLATGANASLTATAGSQVDLGSLYLGRGGTGVAVFDGAGTTLRLNGDGRSARLTLGMTTDGSLTVSGGALLDGSYQPANCLVANPFCGTIIGDAAGSSGGLTVSGAGSEARLIGPVVMALGSINGPGYGTAGATTRASVRVEAGGLLRTEPVSAGSDFIPPAGNGQESKLVTVLVDGAGSRWLIGGGSLVGNDAGIDFAHGARVSATLDITHGGRLEVQGDPGRNFGLRLGTGGSFSGTVSGTNSVLWANGDPTQGYIHLAEGGGTARLDVTQGGLVGGGRYVQVGLNGGTATLNLDGGAADFSGADVAVGNAGTGTLTLTHGGRMDARQLNVASGQQSSQGTIALDGSSTVLALRAVDAHRLSVGAAGTGALMLSGGALLDAGGDVAACAGRWCGSFIGQFAGSTARFTVTGIGSEARFIGDLSIGDNNVSRPGIEGFTAGEINGATRARVEVLAGGLLRTESVNVGGWSYGGSQGGGERSFADLVVNGSGSTWLIAPDPLSNRDAVLNLARSRGAVSTLEIADGGLLRLQAPTGRNASADLTAGRYAPGDPTAGGGSSVTTVRGTGSRFEINGETSRLVVGNSAGGNALLQVKDGGAVTQGGRTWSYLNIGETSATGRVEILTGGQVSGARVVNVGSGGDGSLLISGAGSLLTTDRSGTAVGQLNVGQQGQGRVDVQNGGAASVFSLQVGQGASWGDVVIDGAGSQVAMDALDRHRMSINNGSVLVSGGALLDATVNAAACANRWCGTFIANNAGDTGVFTVTGKGSLARFISNFNVGQSDVTAPPATPWTLGEPGGTTLAQVNVMAGGRLETEQVFVAQGPSGPASTGSESVIAQVRVKGAGSVWSISGANGRAGGYTTGIGAAANTLTDLQITDGGQLQLSADATTATYVQLGANGGVHRMSVTGRGSKVVYGTTNNAGLWVGRNGATASLSVANGGAIEGINRLQVGNTGASGSLTVAGGGSRIDYGPSFADLFIGRQGGNGAAAITQGGVVSMTAALPRLFIGSGEGVAGTTGALRLDGAGSLLNLTSPASAAGAFDLPQANIGWGGTGTVDVTGGAQLSLLGQGTSTVGQPANTRLTVGQSISNLPGTGTLNISGTDSRVRVTGTDAAVFIGRSAGGSGTLNLAAGAAVDTTLLDVGLGGGVGTLQANASTITLTGQWAGSSIGSTLGIGLAAGSVGSVRLANGSLLSISNPGSQGASLLIGGANSAPGGNGSLVVRASTVQIAGPSGATGAVVGYNGSGLASFENASTLDVGSTGSVIVGWKPGSTGALNVSGGSTVLANYVGIGASAEGDGGVASLIVNDTSSLTATTIEVGSKGYVGGTGTLIGNIINRGVFNPGNSPGTLHLQGSFANQTGGRLVLEVGSDGAGGFITDQLVFDAGTSVSLGSVQIEFRFLGAADPNAFLASGAFQIDSFLRQGGSGLNHALLGNASFSATSTAYQFTSFTFTPDGGAVFQAQAVPEPATWALWGLGLACGSWLHRRRQRA
ncbi:MAG: PEP-CTERM sorting domain-containing protein [Burkholderiales bacterium]|nr:MAG: PEP-CTERM sorting domain-containing protein [Burkholderiales bacterium]